MARQVKVQVAGTKFAIRTDAKPAYIRKLAALVDEHVAAARKSGKTITTQSLALMAAMSLADELLQQQERERELRRSVKERTEKILKYLHREANA